MKSDNIVIGNGLLAKNFKKLSSSKKCLFFCSGVSNSEETNPENFSREKDLLLSCTEKIKNMTFVYFSSVLVGQLRTDYYLHKYKMEELVKKSFNRYLIIKLPQVAGITHNKTLLNYFIMNILDNNRLLIQRESSRNIIDIIDVVRVVDLVLKNGIKNENINIGSKQNIKPLEIAKIIEATLNTKLSYTLINGGTEQEIDLSSLNLIINDNDILNQLNYKKNVIIKYTKLFKKNHV